MYILHSDADGRHLIIDKLKNNDVILYSKVGGTVLPIVKCKLSRLSFIFSLPNDAVDSHAVRLDHHNTESVIRFILGDKDSRNCKLYKPNAMMYFKMFVKIVKDKYILHFEVYYNVWKKTKNNVGYNSYDEMITTNPMVVEYNLTTQDFLKVITHINIFNKAIADSILKESL